MNWRALLLGVTVGVAVYTAYMYWSCSMSFGMPRHCVESYINQQWKELDKKFKKD